ncbi:MAG: hypothetical protein M0Z60_05805 [Nitrospiraceae bacterium]|nr:hypothetical protein [Nitrospiraceae bacterium]
MRPIGCLSWKRMLSAVAGWPLIGSLGLLRMPFSPGPTIVLALSGSWQQIVS